MFKLFSDDLKTTPKAVMTHQMKREPPTPKRVLIVDDEEPIRKFVGRVLSDVGYETAFAVDGVEALLQSMAGEAGTPPVHGVVRPHGIT